MHNHCCRLEVRVSTLSFERSGWAHRSIEAIEARLGHLILMSRVASMNSPQEYIE